MKAQGGPGEQAVLLVRVGPANGRVLGETLSTAEWSASVRGTFQWARSYAPLAWAPPAPGDALCRSTGATCPASRGGSAPGLAVRPLAQGHSVCGLLAAVPGRANGADGRSVTRGLCSGPGPPSLMEGKKLRIRSLSFSGIEELYKTHSQIECSWQIDSKCCLGTEDIRWGKADPPRCPVRVCPLPWCSPSVLGRAPAPRLAGSSVGRVTQGLWRWGQLR